MNIENIPQQEYLRNKIRYLFEQGSEYEEHARELERRTKVANRDWKSNEGSVETEVWLKRFITCNPTMLQLKEDIRKCALVDDPVLIQGETGTGKELIARALHGGRGGEFRAINVTNLPAELLESELFGHVRGSFTGAVNDKAGLFQSAHNGTIFLDEIGDMPVDMQSKLLRALQDKKARRLGSNEEYDWNARIVAATNQNIWDRKFRADLYHRLSVLTLHTLPLRDRLEDIQMIVDSLCPEFPKEYVWYESYNQGNQVGKKLIDHLQGNVRSIQKIIRRWQVLGRLEE